MKALITGGGFVGEWLARAMLARGDAVSIAGLSGSEKARLLSSAERDGVRWLAMDIRSAADVDRAVERTRPDAIIHLAGISFPPDAERSPEETYDVNVAGAVRLLSAVDRQRATGTDPVVLVIGSAVQYGRHDDTEMPLRESAEQRPFTMYGASKAAQEIAALQMFRASGIRVICTRSFNHSGVGHLPQYLLPSIVARVRAIRRGGAPSLTLGNDVVRDYLHVDDVVTAYLSLLERGRVGEVYNVASGRGISVRQLAHDVLLHAGVSAEITTEATLKRASDIPTLIGDPAKLRRDTGWAPAKTHADIIDDLLHAEAD